MTIFWNLATGVIFRYSNRGKSGIPGNFYCSEMTTQVFLKETEALYQKIHKWPLDMIFFTGPSYRVWTITSLFKWGIIFVWSLELQWNLSENFRNLKIIFIILSQKTKKERRGLPLEQNKENNRYILLNKKVYHYNTVSCGFGHIYWRNP